MLAQQRQEAIVEEVNEKGSVLVKELAIKYNVTQDSIRKDLNILQKQGLLKKTYGGAVRIRKKIAAQDLVASKRISQNRPAKQAIAQRAYQLIEPNDLIFLDLSTSNLELARLLVDNDKGATIVTNMLDIANLYATTNNRHFILLGGHLNQQGDAFAGALAMAQLSPYQFDKAFIGIEGVDIESGKIFNYSVEDALTKQAVLKQTKSTYMMLETRKFEMTGNYAFAHISDFTGVIMEKSPEEKYIRALDSLEVIDR